MIVRLTLAGVVLAAIPSALVGLAAGIIARRNAGDDPNADQRARTAFRQGFLITFAVLFLIAGLCVAGLAGAGGEPA